MEAPCFREGNIPDVLIRQLKVHRDQRGWLVELFRQDELPENLWPVMGYLSQTEPGVVRGPHEHREQADHFVFLGFSKFRLYLWDNRPESGSYRVHRQLDFPEGEIWSVVVPPGVVHAYRNIGMGPGLVFNCPNRLYAGWGRKHPVDEIRHEERADNPFSLHDRDG